MLSSSTTPPNYNEEPISSAPQQQQWLFVGLGILIRLVLAGFFFILALFSMFLADSGTQHAKTIASFVFFACFGLGIGILTKFLPLLSVAGSVFLTYVCLATVYTTLDVPSDNLRASKLFVACLWMALILPMIWWCFCQQQQQQEQEPYNISYYYHHQQQQSEGRQIVLA